MNDALKSTILAVLASENDMTVATLRSDGWPQATTVSFVNEGLTLYFATSPFSQKAANIARDRRVAITVSPRYEDWDHIKGLSLAGHAERVEDPAVIERVGAEFLQKFPQAANYVPGDPAELALFKVTLKVVSVLDYTKGFGHTDLVEL
jgi:general stress protein 26